MLDLDIAPSVTVLTWLASMCRSGSAIETKKPRRSPAAVITIILLGLVISSPIWFPIGVIPRSTPKRNIVRPAMIRAAPMISLAVSGPPSGVSVKFSTRAIKVTGSTEVVTSKNFCFIISINSLLQIIKLMIYRNKLISQ